VRRRDRELQERGLMYCFQKVKEKKKKEEMRIKLRHNWMVMEAY
jgi:hypothetical protein